VADEEVQLAPVVRFVEATRGKVASIRANRLPVASTSLWTRSAFDDPAEIPLRLHFEVKDALGFDHAVIVRHRTSVVRQTRTGERIGSHQQLRSVSGTSRTPLGPGRRWEVDLVLFDARERVVQVETFTALGYRPEAPTARPVRTGPPRPDPGTRSGEARWTDRTIARAAAACRVWAPVHHDPVAARRADLPGVIACTQHLVAMVEHSVGSLWEPGSVGCIDIRFRRPVAAGPAPVVTVQPGRGRSDARVRVVQAGAVSCEATVVHR